MGSNILKKFLNDSPTRGIRIPGALRRNRADPNEPTRRIAICVRSRVCRCRRGPELEPSAVAPINLTRSGPTDRLRSIRGGFAGGESRKEGEVGERRVWHCPAREQRRAHGLHNQTARSNVRHQTPDTRQAKKTEGRVEPTDRTGHKLRAGQEL